MIFALIKLPKAAPTSVSQSVSQSGRLVVSKSVRACQYAVTSHHDRETPGRVGKWPLGAPCAKFSKPRGRSVVRSEPGSGRRSAHDARCARSSPATMQKGSHLRTTSEKAIICGFIAAESAPGLSSTISMQPRTSEKSEHTHSHASPKLQRSFIRKLTVTLTAEPWPVSASAAAVPVTAGSRQRMRTGVVRVDAGCRAQGAGGGRRIPRRRNPNANPWG
jgi:hypothetical protein